MICCSGILLACNPDKEKNEMISKIETLQNDLKNTQQNIAINPNKSIDLIHLYTTFANTYPKDTLTPKYLFYSAEMLIAIKKYDEANAVYDRIMSEYPNYVNTPFSLFLKGFNFENNLYDTGNAKKCYEAFLNKYPNHKLANDVKMSLLMLGKTPEELVKEFESNQQKNK